MRIEKVKWEDGEGFEDFILWGLKPINALVEYLQETNSGLFEIPPERIETISYLIGELIEKAEDCIRRFMDEINSQFIQYEDFIDTFIDELCIVGEDCQIEDTKLYHTFAGWFGLNISQKIPNHVHFYWMYQPLHNYGIPHDSKSCSYDIFA